MQIKYGKLFFIFILLVYIANLHWVSVSQYPVPIAAYAEPTPTPTPETQPTSFVSVALLGRLGNQLFQAASSYGIAGSRGSRWCIQDLENSILSSAVVFRVEPERCPSDVHFEGMGEGVRFHHFHAQFKTDMPGENVHVGDYLQSYKYFSHTELPFLLKDGYWASAWVKERGIKVGVHVRRGDYAVNDLIGAVPGPSFYAKAFGLIPSFNPAEVVVCSDDPAWVRSQPIFGGGMLITEGHTAGQDLAILAACRYVVVSIGTFGWWGGFLAHHDRQSTVIYDSEPYKAGRVDADDVKEDFFPPSWIGVSPN